MDISCGQIRVAQPLMRQDNERRLVSLIGSQAMNGFNKMAQHSICEKWCSSVQRGTSENYLIATLARLVISINLSSWR